MIGVSVVIPSWNQSRLVAEVLSNLKLQTVPPDEIIVVDNGSTDDSVATARSLGALVLELGRNVGFAAAVNEGIRAAQGEWLLLLNNDVQLDPEWIACALRAAQTEDARIVAGKLLQSRKPQYLDGTWDLISRAGCAWRCGWNAPDGPLWNERRRFRISSLTAVLIHRSVFDTVGLLDTRYESYYEDVDFGLRCALAGYSGVYEPQAVGHHWGSATLGPSSRVTYLVSRNQVLLAAKFGLWHLFRWPVLVGQLCTLIPSLRIGHWRVALRGKRDGWKTARRMAPERSDAKQLRQLLEETEKELKGFQQRLGFDLSWRVYFFLTGR
jgi:GT2 family glycosyltransferase